MLDLVGFPVGLAIALVYCALLWVGIRFSRWGMRMLLRRLDGGADDALLLDEWDRRATVGVPSELDRLYGPDRGA